MLKTTLLTTILLCGLTELHAVEKLSNAIGFQYDVLPILSKHCLSCHGFDAAARQADLRLDIRDGAIAIRSSGAAIAPGSPDTSELIRRIASTDADTVMPPPEHGERLSERDVTILRQWIEQGAEYATHWSFVPLAKPKSPLVPGCSNPIDAFVATKLQELGLSMSPPAAHERWFRRVTFDLIGLPPTLQEWTGFQADLARNSSNHDACYERVVERLLASPRFGEHLAVGWLDSARYADTNGYFSDKPRQMWLWRDWVIKAFNTNMPFDQFTIEQLAGDLLPASTIDQRVATGFNRNHMANNETGIIDEEFRVEYVVDRVQTTMTTWLGLTVGCAQCHDHKYDPISQRDYYRLFAFFNSIEEMGLITSDNPPPLITVPSDQQSQRLQLLASDSQAALAAYEPLKSPLAEVVASSRFTPRPNAALDAQEPILLLHDDFNTGLPVESKAVGTSLTFEDGLSGQAPVFDGTQHIEVDLSSFDPDQPWTIGFWCQPTSSLGCPLSKIQPLGERRGIEVLLAKGIFKIHLNHRWGVDGIELATQQAISNSQWHHIVISYDGSRSARGVQVNIDGRPDVFKVDRDTLTGTLRNAEPLRIGRRDSGLGFYGRIDELHVLQQLIEEQSVNDWYWNQRIHGLLAIPADKRKSADTEALFDFFLSDDGQTQFAIPEDLPLDLPITRSLRQRLQSAQQAEQQLRRAIPTALVMQDMKQPRTAHVLQRGVYDQLGEVVLPGVPTVVAAWPEHAPQNRLGLAHWLVSPQNPLTPRVAVNRLWQHCFGAGLVRTADDFGVQGELPTHPELLDWLAASFRDQGWDVKRLLRQIVTSRTYRQDSQSMLIDGQVFDPENRLLARGPRFRLSAEMVRDQALALSGLLVSTIGGPSVNSYQPDGLWEAVSYNAEDVYIRDSADGLWRRSLYSTIKRQVPPPWLLAFDGPTREKCTVKRPVTNTPLQALVLLNDETYVEAARMLAATIMEQADSDSIRMELLWRTVLTRQADSEELDILYGLLERQRAYYDDHPDAAHQLLAVGAAPMSPDGSPVELALWTLVAQAVLSLDEAITKR